MKKKLLMACLAVLAAVVLALPAAAQSAKAYFLKDANVNITLPVGWTVFEPPFQKDNPNLSWYGVSAKKLTLNFKQMGIALNAVQTSPRMGFVVNVRDAKGQVSDLKKTDSKEKQKIWNESLIWNAKHIGNAFPDVVLPDIDAKLKIASHAEYKTKNADFLTLRGSVATASGNIYAYQGMTIKNGKYITLTLYSADGPLSNAQAKLLDAAMDSLTPISNAWIYVVVVVIAAAGVVLFFMKRKKRN